MASLKERVTEKIDRIRERRPIVDHVFSTFAHYGTVNGNAQAGAVTFFGFLSFFPILALAFFVIGYISKVYPDAQDQLVTALEEVLPGLIGDGPGEIELSTFEQNASTIGLIGLAGVLYSGLGWLSGMRNALEVMFALPKKEQPNFVLGKARDLMVLAMIGFVLIVSVALSGAIAGFSEQILAFVELDDSWLAAAVLWLVGHALAIAATTLLLVAMFRLLAKPHVPRTALVHGAVLGAVGFEVLKALASYLIASTKDQPAFQAFGVALILLVWINYFSRLVMYGAAWAYTSPLTEDPQAETDAAAAAAVPASQPGGRRPLQADARPGAHAKLVAAAGAAAALAAAGAIALRRHQSPE